MKIHHVIIHHIRKYHKLRKKKDDVLPAWKERWHAWNERHFHWLEAIVEHAIPWLIFLLLIVIFFELSDKINFFDWRWLDLVAKFALSNEPSILIIDRIIISFFVIDLYFSFFKKAKLWTFVKHYFLDIIAVFPFGLFIRAEVTAVQETQSAIHFIGETEKEVSKLSRIERIGVAFERFLVRSARFFRVAAQFSRTLRLYRIIDFFKLKRKKNKHKKKKHHKKK